MIQKKKRYFDYFCFKIEDRWWLQQRAQGDIWAGLHQFYLVEQEKLIPASQVYFKELLSNQLMVHSNTFKISLPIQVYTQQLTHQLLSVRFVVVELSKVPEVLEKGNWVKRKSFGKYAFPKTINLFLDQEGL